MQLPSYHILPLLFCALNKKFVHLEATTQRHGYVLNKLTAAARQHHLISSSSLISSDRGGHHLIYASTEQRHTTKSESNKTGAEMKGNLKILSQQQPP